MNEPDLYKDVFTQVVKTYPPLARYDIARVKRQIVAGKNYFFVLERTNSVYEKVSVTVYVDLQNNYQISSTQNDFSVGYSLEVIDQVKAIALKKWSELHDYSFYQATNLKADNSGLRLIYRSLSSEAVRYVDLELVNGKESLTLNSP